MFKNFSSKSAEGISYALILSWFGGDMFKTFYFLHTEAPM
jgi:hypothetical protein